MSGREDANGTELEEGDRVAYVGDATTIRRGEVVRFTPKRIVVRSEEHIRSGYAYEDYKRQGQVLKID